MGLLSGLPGLRRAFADPDLALDLGTANTRVCSSRRGLIVDEPSLVGVSADSGSVSAVGARARRLADRGTAHAVRPLRAGVVDDVDAAAAMLAPMLRRAGGLGLVRPRVLACVPTDACETERAALVEAVSRAGAGSVRIVPEPLAAAIGCGLDVASPYAQMIVDIGDGVTDIAVIRSGEVTISNAVRTACSDLYSAVRSAVASEYGITIDALEAERLTREAGVGPTAGGVRLYGSGTRMPRGERIEFAIGSADVARATDPAVRSIVDALCETVRNLPVLTSCEIIESGICLTGGGARLRGMMELLAEATSLDVRPAADPLHAVINGARKMLSVGRRTGFWVN